MPNTNPMANWLATARPEQLPPSEPDWKTWVIIAGRGWGKTRAASEWIRSEIYAGKRRLALVGPSMEYVRSEMVGSPSGIASLFAEAERPVYADGRGVFVFPHGAELWCYPAHDRIIFKKTDGVWAENPELWMVSRKDVMQAICDSSPRVVITSRPKPGLDIASLLPVGRPIAFSTGGTLDNAANLDPAFVESVQATRP